MWDKREDCFVLFLRSESQTYLNANEKEPVERKKCKIRSEWKIN